MNKLDAYNYGIHCFDRGMTCFQAIDWFDRYHADYATAYRFNLIDGWESASNLIKVK